MTTHLRIATAVALAIAGTSHAARAGAVRADVVRTSSYMLDIGDDLVSSGAYAVDWSISGESEGGPFFVEQPLTNLAMLMRLTHRNAFAEGSGDVLVNSVSVAGRILSVDWGLEPTSPDEVNGHLRVGYDFDSVDGPPGAGLDQQSFVFRRSEAGRRLLRFAGGGEGLVAPGDGFVVDVTMNGRWDPAGQGEGSVRFLGLHDSFTIQEFFTYDPASDTTRFLASTDSYVADPNLSFDLVGVPTPGAAAVPALFIAMTGQRRRR